MSQTAPEEFIKELIYKQSGRLAETITPDKHLADDLGLDSLDILFIGSELEKHFSITINDRDIENLNTVNSLVLLVVNKCNSI
jgi:acyl carrier protein